MTNQPRNDTPGEYARQDLAAEWRRVAVWGYAVIDQALDCSPSEAHAILLEAVAALEGAIDELDGRPA